MHALKDIAIQAEAGWDCKFDSMHIQIFKGLIEENLGSRAVAITVQMDDSDPAGPQRLVLVGSILEA